MKKLDTLFGALMVSASLISNAAFAVGGSETGDDVLMGTAKSPYSVKASAEVDGGGHLLFVRGKGDVEYGAEITGVALHNTTVYVSDQFGTSTAINYFHAGSAKEAYERIKAGKSIGVADCIKEGAEIRSWTEDAGDGCSRKISRVALYAHCGNVDKVQWLETDSIDPNSLQAVSIKDKELFLDKDMGVTCKDNGVNSGWKNSPWHFDPGKI